MMIDLLRVRVLAGAESDESYAEGISFETTPVTDFLADWAHPFECLLNSDRPHLAT